MKSKGYKLTKVEVDEEDLTIDNYYGNRPSDRMSKSELIELLDELWAENEKLLNQVDTGESPYKDAISKGETRINRLECTLEKARDTIVDLKEKLKDIEDATAATYKRKIAAITREHNRYARQANDAYLKAQEEITKLKEQIANIHGLRTIIQPRRITPDLADRR